MVLRSASGDCSQQVIRPLQMRSNTGDSKVAFRETIRKQSDVDSKYKNNPVDMDSTDM